MMWVIPDKTVNFIKDNVSYPARLEQLAEEASELAHAALKLSRIIRGESPTPTSQQKAYEKLEEEFSDVTLMAYLCDLEASDSYMEYKAERFEKRIEAHNMEQKRRNK